MHASWSLYEPITDHNMLVIDCRTSISSPLVLSTICITTSPMDTPFSFINCCRPLASWYVVLEQLFSSSPRSRSIGGPLSLESCLPHAWLAFPFKCSSQVNYIPLASLQSMFRDLRPFEFNAGVSISNPRSDFNCAANPRHIDRQRFWGYIAASAALPATNGT